MLVISSSAVTPNFCRPSKTLSTGGGGGGATTTGATTTSATFSTTTGFVSIYFDGLKLGGMKGLVLRLS